MADLDEISRAIGRIEGKLDGLEAASEMQQKKLERVESYILQHKGRIAGYAAGISLAVTIGWAIFKEWLQRVK